ncbi:hypothetical protein GLOIN_2v1777673 [Rhizophagus clarus]|uniref:F-box domain-containing protein n=1 Tax=Rhizophagus clarus TaxID=94130 RepID=A0A8H3QCH0_9GLOM|nr:hypothetical protein GLOIN_2v1777673 [Rhizophagus clarus]
MSKLNRDILCLIFEELRDDNNALHRCISINKTCCGIIIPLLWSNPWKFLRDDWEYRKKKLLKVIISHLSDKSKNNLKNQYSDLLTKSYQKPLFDYISFCRHLNLNELHKVINTTSNNKYNDSIIESEIFKLFVNENTKFTHLYIPRQLDYQLHLTERCFSGIEFFSCSASVDDDILSGLTKICKSIKELKLFIGIRNNNHGIIELIKAQKKIQNISFLADLNSQIFDESFSEDLENSLIKHVNTIQYFKITKQPTTKILSLLVNLKSLELDGSSHDMEWNCLKNLSLPYLQILKASRVPVNVLADLIENTNGFLFKIKIDYIRHVEVDNKRIIRIIYQNCPNLRYLKLLFRNCNILELENLLISCKYLGGLYIIINNIDDAFEWDNLFEILAKSSPKNLFKFKFGFHTLYRAIKLESLELFFNNWKGRHPMILQFSQANNMQPYSDLIERYKAKGVIKNYYNNWHFEWF